VPDDLAPPPPLLRRHRVLVRRHSLLVRITHWANAGILLVLLLSGLQIFNAHPALYWGQQSNFDHPLLSMFWQQPQGKPAQGLTYVLGHTFVTTGVFGLSRDGLGHWWPRGFPAWLTLPASQNLAYGRLWHFFFAWLLVFNGAVYWLYGLASRHIPRDLVPSRRDLRDIPHDVWQHLRLHFPKGEAARRYNVLQKGVYLAIVAVVLPVLILAGLAMSPRMDAGFPWLLTLFDGRQSARTVHFVCAMLLVLFTAVHLLMVVLSGVWNNLRSMVTGRYAIETETAGGAAGE
jgi:thiosulfate reductase cytochrome b subunit